MTPSDRGRVQLSHYQSETVKFVRGVYEDLGRGDVPTAKKKLKYFADNSNWQVAMNPTKLFEFFDGARCAGKQGSSAVDCRRRGR
jgi:hypothetical protein